MNLYPAIDLKEGKCIRLKKGELKEIFNKVKDNKDGAVGIVLNYKVMTIKGAQLFKKLNIENVSNNLDTKCLSYKKNDLYLISK